MRNAYFLRCERGETQLHVARATGLSPDTLADFERGRSEPRAPTVKRLADYYGVSARELFEIHKAAA